MEFKSNHHILHNPIKLNSIMKVLWFSLSPCNSIKRNNSSHVIQGWMISLEEELKKNTDIQLEVAFFSETYEKPFEFEQVKYYPMYRNILSPQYGINRIRERFIKPAIKDKKSIDIMLDIIKKSQPNIIHIHGTEEAFGLITNFIHDIPIIFSIQGLISPYKEKYFTGIPQNIAYKLDSISDRIKGMGIKRQYNTFCYKAEREKHYLRHAKYILGRTFWDQYITELFNPQRTYFTVNEILRKPFYQSQWNKKQFNNTIHLVSIVSIGIYKGYETLLKAALLLKQNAQFNFEWEVIGYNPDSKYASMIHRMTKIDPLICNINFHGMLDANQIVNKLIQSDIYCHVSHIENSPNSVCEAMILGMPIIASNTGGTASLLENDKEGILYQDGDPYILAGSIIKLVSNFTLAKQMGIEARKRALERHNRQNVVRELLYAYNQVLNNDGK